MMQEPGVRRRRVAQILDVGAPEDRTSRNVDIFLMTLISINVAAIVLESVPSIAAQYSVPLGLIEALSVSIFSVEYVLRLWSAPDLNCAKFKQPWLGRLRYAATPAAVIDLVAILPFFLGIFFQADLRFLRVFRLFRIFKLTRYSTTMDLIFKVFRDEAGAFIGAFFMLFVLLVLTASGIYLLENDVQPDKFGSIPAAMWWAMATLTTVGYGDVTPVTGMGRFFGGLITIIGVGMVALPTGILASGFAEQLRTRRRQYTHHLEDALADGVITQQEQSSLERLRTELDIDPQDAQALLRLVLSRRSVPEQCPHCHMSLSDHRLHESSPQDSSSQDSKLPH